MILSALPRLPACFLLLSLLAPAHARAGEVLGDDFNEEESRDYKNLPTLRLSLEAGYSHWFYDPSLASQSYQDYADKLETGWDYAAQISYFPWDKGGIGAEWIWYLTRAGADGVQEDTATGAPPRSLRDRVSFTYYGPTFLTRLQFNHLGLLVGSVGAGLLLVHWSGTDNGRYYLLEAKTYAVVAAVGWEYSFFRSLAAGINARVILADMNEYTYNGKKVVVQQPDDPNYRINIYLNRIEFNLGLRFGL